MCSDHFFIIIIDAVEAESGFNDFIVRPCIPLQLCVSVSFFLDWSQRKLAVSEWTSIRGTTIRLRNSYNSILSRWVGADFSPLLFLLLNLYLKLLLSQRAPKKMVYSIEKQVEQRRFWCYIFRSGHTLVWWFIVDAAVSLEAKADRQWIKHWFTIDDDKITSLPITNY